MFSRNARVFTKLSDIARWSEVAQEVAPQASSFSVNPSFNSKISLWQGDMTKIEVDAIVNAANESLLGGGGIDGAIHSAAGSRLLGECRTLNGCDPGDAKITRGYNLPSKHIIHTVGPRGEYPDVLRSCYRRCLDIAVENELRSICFCCISTGVFGYPNDHAAEVALRTVREYLEENGDENFDRIVFCSFLRLDKEIYEELTPKYFPKGEEEGEEGKEEGVAMTEDEDDEENEENEGATRRRRRRRRRW
jgi:O-acetyl-ADP-ribose deacetylase (regulator of RNase III)